MAGTSPICRAVLQHDGRNHLAGIDHAVLVRALFALSEIDGNQRQLKSLLGEENADAPGVGRAGGVVKLHSHLLDSGAF